MFPFFSGMRYLIQGFNHLLTPGLKRFIIMPIVFNFILFAGLFYLIYHYLLPYAHQYIAKLPSWLSFLSGVLFILFIVGFILLFLALFTVMFNIIAAPFNGLLAEKVQKLLYNRPIPAIPFYVMAVRSIKRQGQFLSYFLPRLMGMLLLFFVPFMQPLYPFIWFLFSAWMLSIQFQDVALDNNLIDFPEMKKRIKNNKMRSLGFGALINLASFIPGLNILMMPAAVIGGTILYCDTSKTAKAHHKLALTD